MFVLEPALQEDAEDHRGQNVRDKDDELHPGAPEDEELELRDAAVPEPDQRGETEHPGHVHEHAAANNRLHGGVQRSTWFNKKLEGVLRDLLEESKKYNDSYKSKLDPISKIILLKKNNKLMISNIRRDLELFRNFVRVVDYMVVQNMLIVKD